MRYITSIQTSPFYEPMRESERAPSIGSLTKMPAMAEVRLGEAQNQQQPPQWPGSTDASRLLLLPARVSRKLVSVLRLGLNQAPAGTHGLQAPRGT